MNSYKKIQDSDPDSIQMLMMMNNQQEEKNEAPPSISPASVPSQNPEDDFILIHQREEMKEQLRISQVTEKSASTDAEIFEDFIQLYSLLNSKQKSVKILHTLLKNLGQNPDQEKFKKIRFANKAIKENIIDESSAIEILFMTGFEKETAQDGDQYLYYKPATKQMPDPFLLSKWIELMGFDPDASKPTTASSTATTSKGGGNYSFTLKDREIMKANSSKNTVTNRLAQAHLARQQRAKYMPKRPVPVYETQLDDYKKKAKEKDVRTRVSKTITLTDIENMRKQELLANPTPLVRLGMKALDQTNEFRKSHQLPALLWSQALHDIAMEHSYNMHEKKVKFGHDGFSQRSARIPFYHTGSAENVAYNYGVGDPVSTAIVGWINSPGHCRNMLSPFTLCGIAVFAGKNGYYFTQFFAK